MTERDPILQHIYTRDREGVFRTTEGFDTVAMSPSLDRRFVQSVLQPYCLYKAPKELLTRSESSGSLYPDSTTVFPASNGMLVAGRSLYVSADFTGQRSSTFTHQLIIPELRKDEFLQKPEKLFQMNSFVSRYDIREGKQLPELSDVTFTSEHVDFNLLDRVGFDEHLFKQLVYAVMASLSPVKTGPKRKIYVSLNSDISVCSDDAKRLCILLYKLLPWEIRRQLGVVTYNNEPESRQNIQLMFVEKGSIAAVEKGLERDVLFDIDAKKFRNTELPGKEHIYLDYVWEHRYHEAVLEAFFRFCDEALADLPVEIKHSIPSYYQLCALFQIKEDSQNTTLYESNRAGHLNAISSFLSKDKEKPQLLSLYMKLLNSDVLRQYAPDLIYIQSLMSIYEKLSASDQEYTQQMLSIFIHNIAEYGQGMTQALEMLQVLKKDNKVYLSIIRMLINRNPKLIKKLFLQILEQVDSANKLHSELTMLRTVSKSLWRNALLIQEAENTTRFLIQKDQHKPIPITMKLNNLIDILIKEGQEDADALARGLEKVICVELLGLLMPEQLNEEEWRQLDFLVNVDAQSWKEWDISKQEEEKLMLIKFIYAVVTFAPEDRLKSLKLEGNWEMLGGMSLEARNILKNLFKLKLDENTFHMLLFAFISGQQDNSHYEYPQLIRFVYEKGGSEALGRLVSWVNYRKPFDRNVEIFYSSLKAFFTRTEPTLLKKNKLLKKKLKSIKIDSKTTLLRKVSNESTIKQYLKMLKLKQWKKEKAKRDINKF